MVIRGFPCPISSKLAKSSLFWLSNNLDLLKGYQKKKKNEKNQKDSRVVVEKITLMNSMGKQHKIKLSIVFQQQWSNNIPLNNYYSNNDNDQWCFNASKIQSSTIPIAMIKYIDTE